MQTEIIAFERIGTWDIMNFPPNVKPIVCRWILKIKFCVDGSVEKFKENIVAKGYNQIE